MIKYSQLEQGKEYKANCPYWFDAVFFFVDGRLHYRRSRDEVRKTTYDMYPGFINCMWYEYIKPEPVKSKIPESTEPTFTFFDDLVDHTLQSKKYDSTTKDWDKVGMSAEQWRKYLWDRVDRTPGK